MPGWHAATKTLREQGKIRTIGIVQEQHPERARLFLQWKQMDLPVMVDSFDLLEVGVVPITLLIDEHGMIRGRPGRTDPARALASFVETQFEPPVRVSDVSSATRPNLQALRQTASHGDAEDWRLYAEAQALWGGSGGVGGSIAAFARAIDKDASDAWSWFRAGVSYRMRYDGDHGRPDDFLMAVRHWTRATELDPNNYIWMRRLQQFGPRQGKPYPFYDWVDTARAEIEARGEEPVALPVEPRGAELSLPASSFAVTDGKTDEPDPEGKITRDPGRLVRVTATTVPAALAPASSARVHLEFRPVIAADAHWNNEVGGLRLWLDPPAGWQLDRRSHELAPPPGAVSDEIRRIEFEVRSPDEPVERVALPAYALYYVCEGIEGQCLYRRQDLSIRIDPKR